MTMAEEKMGLPSSKWQADDAGEDDGNEDELNEDGVLFYVNKSGCPLDEHTWNRMWNHVAKIHPDGSNMTNSIRNKTDLPEVIKYLFIFYPTVKPSHSHSPRLG